MTKPSAKVLALGKSAQHPFQDVNHRSERDVSDTGMVSGDAAAPIALHGLGALYAGALAWWVERVRRFAWAVVIATVAVTAAAGYYAMNNLGLTTDTDALISNELPYRKIYKAFDHAFPQLGDNLVVVVDAPTPDEAEDATLALANRLAANTNLFGELFFPTGSPFFRRSALLFLQTDELESQANNLADAEPLIATLAQDTSLRGLFNLLAEAVDEVAKGDTKPDLLLRPFAMIGDTIKSRLEGQPKSLSWRALMSPDPIKPSERRQLIIAKPRLDYSGLMPARKAIDAVHQAARELGLDTAYNARVRLTGSAAINEDEFSTVQKSMGLAGIVSLSLVAFLVFIGLRSPVLVLATVVTLMISLVWTTAFAALAVGHVNLISIGFAVLFIGLAIDFGIQFGLRYKEALDNGRSHGEALRDASINTGAAVGLAALCAAIGFGAFVPTSYVGLSELGIIASAGMFIGLFGTMTLLPAILTLRSPHPARRRRKRVGNVAVGKFVECHPRAILIGALALAFAAIGTLPEVRFDFDPIDLKDPTAESVQAYRDLANESDTSPYSVSVLEPDLRAADATAKRLKELPEVNRALTLSSFVPEDQPTKLAIIDQMALFLMPVLEIADVKSPPSPNENRAAVDAFRASLATLIEAPRAGELARLAGRLGVLLDRYMAGPGRQDRGLAALEGDLLASLPGRLAALRDAMAARPVTLDDLPQDLRSRYVTADGRARVEVLPAERLADEDSLRRFVTSVRSIAPEATDTPVIMLESGDAVIHAFETAAVLAFFLISVLLVLVLRSAVDTFLVFLPLTLAALLTAAFTVAFDMPFNFANIIALPLLFSLGVAYGIYLVLRLRETMSISRLLTTSTPRAILFSALTTMASFGSLAISSHRGTASMGALLFVSMAIALVCTFCVLPPLFVLRRAILPSRGKAAPPIDKPRIEN